VFKIVVESRDKNKSLFNSISYYLRTDSFKDQQRSNVGGVRSHLSKMHLRTRLYILLNLSYTIWPVLVEVFALRVRCILYMMRSVIQAGDIVNCEIACLRSLHVMILLCNIHRVRKTISQLSFYHNLKIANKFPSNMAQGTCIRACGEVDTFISYC